MSAPQPLRRRGPSRFGRWRTELTDRLARSSRVFLLGVIVACGVEVLVDWNATLFEINVLRDGMRQRGQNYVAILAKAAVEATLAYDTEALDQLSSGLFDDEDVVFVRFADHRGTPLYDRLRPGVDEKIRARLGRGFSEQYREQMTRDVGRVVSDPEALRLHIARSRHRDFVQEWNDLVGALIARVSRPAAPAHHSGVVLYQDRLSRPDGSHDSDVTYALGTIVDERGDPWGVTLVGFSMDRTNAAIRTKYLKGGGMVAFFVALIVVQNIAGRRDKLRLLDLESRYAVAKRALVSALPIDHLDAPAALGASFEQGAGPVDGLVWDHHAEGGTLTLLAVDPEGEGIDAAATALHILKVFRERRAARTDAALIDEARALGAAAAAIPLALPVGLLLLRVDVSAGAAGSPASVEALSGPISRLQILSGGSSRPLRDEPPLEPPAGVEGPLRHQRGELSAGETLLALVEGRTGKADRVIELSALSGALRPALEAGGADLTLAAEEATRWIRAKVPALEASDILVVLLEPPRAAT